jgi:membrane protein DedA with SNARE-associated domain
MNRTKRLVPLGVLIGGLVGAGMRVVHAWQGVDVNVWNVIGAVIGAALVGALVGWLIARFTPARRPRGPPPHPRG